MASVPSGENPFTAIDRAFTRAYAGDPPPPITVTMIGSSETIVGVQDDGGMLSLARADLALKEAQGVFRVSDALPMSDEDIPESDDGNDEPVAEYWVGGSDDNPVVVEIISHEPRMTRELDEVERAELARKIGAATFY